MIAKIDFLLIFQQKETVLENLRPEQVTLSLIQLPA